MSSFTNQTEDIITSILSRLPVKSIGRFRCVSKTWCNLLNNPHFIKAQLEHAIRNNNNFSILVMCRKTCVDDFKVYSIDYDPTSSTYSKPVQIDSKLEPEYTSCMIWGSCNGLIMCCGSELKGDICLWNPSTKESKKIPSPPKKIRRGSDIHYLVPFVSYGFGYDCSIEEYMLVRIFTFTNYSELNVFRLRSNFWESIPYIPYKMSAGVILIFSGALHWIAKDKGGPKEAVVLATYGIGDGRFKNIPLPKDIDDKFNIMYAGVGVLGGCLCVTANLYEVRTEVWVMKDYGVQESWTRLFTIDQHTSAGSFRYLKLIQPLQNGAIMFQKDCNELFVYDPDKGEARTLEIRGTTQREICTWAYSRSLVSPNSIVSSAQEQIRQA